MEFGTGYFGAEPQNHGAVDNSGYFGEFAGNPYGDPVGKPIVGVADIGMSVPEGSRFGSLIKTTTDAIRRGTGWVELSTNMGGGAEAVGAEAYGKDAREALRDLARVNSVKFT